MPVVSLSYETGYFMKGKFPWLLTSKGLWNWSYWLYSVGSTLHGQFLLLPNSSCWVFPALGNCSLSSLWSFSASIWSSWVETLQSSQSSAWITVSTHPCTSFYVSFLPLRSSKQLSSCPRCLSICSPYSGHSPSWVVLQRCSFSLFFLSPIPCIWDWWTMTVMLLSVSLCTTPFSWAGGFVGTWQ